MRQSLRHQMMRIMNMRYCGILSLMGQSISFEQDEEFGYTIWRIITQKAMHTYYILNVLTI